MYKTVAIIVGAFLIMLIGTCAYFVGGVSDTYPPLKEYPYPESFSKLTNNIEALVSADGRFTYEITDTVGDKEVGYKYYVDVKFKRETANLEYHFFYDKTDHWFRKDRTQLGLVFAYNRTQNIGGYGYGDDESTRKLVKIFENEILNRLYK